MNRLPASRGWLMILRWWGGSLLVLAAAFSGVLACPTPQQAKVQSDGSRQVTLESFLNARPQSPSPPVRKGSRRKPTAAAASRLPRYVLVTPPLSADPKAPLDRPELGVTLWRLRPLQPADRGARLLVMDGGQTSQWTPERIEVEQQLALGERVRMSIESPRAGFLYVIDRELYADGSKGPPYLIFPTTRTRGGDHRIQPGALIDIPGQDDQPPFFTLNSVNPNYAGELLTIMVLAQPLPKLVIGRQPLVLSNKQVARWEKQFASQAERFEMDGGSGLAWTTAERVAAQVSGGRSLTQTEPAPQTVYRVVAKTPQGLLVQVPIRSRR
jgi:hypothetical protein